MRARLRADWAGLAGRLTRLAPALPIDLFRVLAGLLALIYFLDLLVQSRDFSSPDGLLDHELIQRVFWYTRLGLFQPGMGLALIRLVYVAACAAAVMLTAGYRVRLAAGLLYVAAVSAYRWNFLAMYVDDAIMHLVFSWLLLLPAGRTLVLAELWRDGPGSLERWKREQVPGAAVRCFLANLALAYLVAGLWKWTSPMWRDGTALYAVLKLPIAHAPQFWQTDHLAWLRPVNHLVLALETLLPLIVCLPANHRLKWLLGLGLLGFHLGIIASLKIPYANLALIAASAIIFRDEIMQRIAGAPARPRPAGPAQLDLPAATAMLFVTSLTAAMLWDLGAPAWRAPSRPAIGVAAAGAGVTAEAAAPGEPADDLAFARQANPLYAGLWMIGIAQSYRLFDWIDHRNFHITYEMAEMRPGALARRLDADELFPRSIRSILLQSYLHGVTWLRVPEADKAEVEASLYRRFTNRYCRARPATGRIEVYATVARMTLDNLDLRDRSRRRFVEFECRAGAAVLHYPQAASD